MKRFTLVVLILLVTLGAGAAVNAQRALFETPNVAVNVTFYAGDPATHGAVITSVPLNNSPVAATIAGIGEATHLQISHEDNPHTFELASSGTSKASVQVLVGEPQKVMTLAALLDALAADPTLLERFGR